MEIDWVSARLKEVYCNGSGLCRRLDRFHWKRKVVEKEKKDRQMVEKFFAVLKEQDEVQEFIDANSRYESNQGTYVCANVKVHDYPDLDGAMEKMPDLSHLEISIVSEHFNDEYLWELHSEWLNQEREWFNDEFMVGHCTDDPEELRMLSVLGHEIKNIFFGRSGGWLALKDIEDLTEHMIDRQEIFEIMIGWTSDVVDDNDWFRSLWEEAFAAHDDMCEIYRAIKWLFTYVEDMANSLSFEDELIYLIRNFIDDQEAA